MHGRIREEANRRRARVAQIQIRSGSNNYPLAENNARNIAPPLVQDASHPTDRQ